MTSSNTITGINPFAFTANTVSVNPFAYLLGNDSIFSGGSLRTQNYSYIPMVSTPSTFDYSMYFGSMTGFSSGFNMDVDSVAKAIVNSCKVPKLNITGLFNTKRQTSTPAISSGLGTSSSYQPIQDNGQSDLKPGLFKGRLAGQEALVSRICRKYGVSPALVASIIGLESGWGTSALAMHNNFGGYRAAGDLGKNAKGFGYFSTIEKGLDAMIKNLASYTKYRDVSKVDFNNLDSIGRHYCEGNVWSGRVRAMYNSRVKNYLA